jgi:hypothetical protein
MPVIMGFFNCAGSVVSGAPCERAEERAPHVSTAIRILRMSFMLVVRCAVEIDEMEATTAGTSQYTPRKPIKSMEWPPGPELTTIP